MSKGTTDSRTSSDGTFDPYALESTCYGRHMRANQDILRLESLIQRNADANSRIEREVESGFAQSRIEQERGFAEIKGKIPGTKAVLGLILTGLLTAGGWVWHIAKMPNRADVAEMIQTMSPYREDRPILRKAASDVEFAVRGLNDTARDLAALMQSHKDQGERVQLFWTKDWPELNKRLERIERRLERR